MSRLLPRIILTHVLSGCLLAAMHFPAGAAPLDKTLLKEDAATLAADAVQKGDAARGAIVFHQPYLTCTQCHNPDASGNRLGPDLAAALDEAKQSPVQIAAHMTESLLQPSAKIRKGYEPVTVVTEEGQVVNGLIASETDAAIVVQQMDGARQRITILKNEIEQRTASAVSVMPQGLAALLTSRQQFLDLVKYLVEVRTGGKQRALELQPPASLLAPVKLPEYESHLDHAGLISTWNKDSFRRGEAIYQRLCINCHGTKEKPGSLPTSLRFASGKFKNGSDPHSMYQTLTRGFGLMVAQTWMAPQQKYDVIHYIREKYLKPHNPSQYLAISDSYLSSLPEGDTRGPAPVKYSPWSDMDYGPYLVGTYEVGKDASNFAYKGIATRLDPGPGGVSRGRHWMIFDHDTFRTAAAWSGKGFIDWNGIHFNGRHNIHPRIAGDVQFANPTGPGWANPETGSFEDPRLIGRDGRHYGPLPKKWAALKGFYRHGSDLTVSYTVGDTSILEHGGVVETADVPVFTRTFNIAPRTREMTLNVAHVEGAGLTAIRENVVTFGQTSQSPASNTAKPVAFDGATQVMVAKAEDFDVTRDFTLTARLRTKQDGVIFSNAAPQGEWAPDCVALFIRGGKLTYDIGWVGAVRTRQNIADGKWHDIACTFEAASGTVTLYVDGKQAATKEMAPKERLKNSAVRLGFAAPDFPGKNLYFNGDLAEVRFFKAALTAQQAQTDAAAKSLVAHWLPAKASTGALSDTTGKGHDGKSVSTSSSSVSGSLIAGVQPAVPGAKFVTGDASLRLQIPAGNKPLRFTLWIARQSEKTPPAAFVKSFSIPAPTRDLLTKTKGGPALWQAKLKSVSEVGQGNDAFEKDVIKRPVDNPWFARMRLTGFDFLPGDRMAVSAWDGSVWMVEGINDLEKGQTWQRIASGLFQPLGVKYVNGRIYVSCRDQIVILNDLNGDGETDYYECFNNDHQVTDHFHEFAMGLQTDEQNNFYYAKSARHALTALVPHHGTLLKVSADGSKTEILATGFRAANGVCLNPDGSFIVTDQEGHWNPKNRINWVRKGGFYGNMYGYHDVTDSSDAAMEQPLCWITNKFDRSPAELLWVDSKKWGALNGTLLNLSYGYGKVYVVPHEIVKGQPQGGMVELPITPFPTGVMRGRFHPDNGQLYLAGMFAWAGSANQPGGLYRLRYKGEGARLPLHVSATTTGLSMEFSDALDAESVKDAANYSVKIWDLKRTKSYGSKHYNEQKLDVTAASLDADGRTLKLQVAGIKPTWCMEVLYSLKDADGRPFTGVMHNTIHQLQDK